MVHQIHTERREVLEFLIKSGININNLSSKRENITLLHMASWGKFNTNLNGTGLLIDKMNEFLM